MAVSEYALPAFVVLIALFGIYDTIRTPFIVRQFYRGKLFEDKGRVSLDKVSGSSLVSEMYTDHLNQKFDNGISVKQFQAWSVNRRKFTLNKVLRKRNQTGWSITVIDTTEPMAVFKLLPSNLPEATSYSDDDKSIEITGDTQIADRYRLVTEQGDVVLPLITQKIRQFLLQTQVVAVECTANQVLLKRHWLPHQVLDRLQTELDIAKLVHDTLALNNKV